MYNYYKRVTDKKHAYKKTNSNKIKYYREKKLHYQYSGIFADVCMKKTCPLPYQCLLNETNFKVLFAALQDHLSCVIWATSKVTKLLRLRRIRCTIQRMTKLVTSNKYPPPPPPKKKKKKKGSGDHKKTVFIRDPKCCSSYQTTFYCH